MSRLMLVRHGQASQDRLTDLGLRQARALAERWREEGIRLDAVWHGALERQRETAAVVAARCDLPCPQLLAGLDEYPAEAIVERLAPRLADDDEAYAALYAAWRNGGPAEQANARFQRMFEPAMRAWLDNRYSDLDILHWTSFQDGVLRALQMMMQAAGKGASIAAFTSGGPIGVIVQNALEAPAAKALQLNWCIRNASVTTLLFHGDRLSLDRFNDTAHLQKDALESFR